MKWYKDCRENDLEIQQEEETSLFPSTLLWDYLGQEVAMTKISVPGQDWPVERVLKEFKQIDCV